MSSAPRSVILTAALGLSPLATSCDLLMPKDEPPPAPSHPGCPGEASRSATSPSDCSCTGGEVLQAGRLECETCDPVSSRGAYCDCGRNSLFSFDGSLEQDLGLVSYQVTCSEATVCPGPEEQLGGSAGKLENAPSEGRSCGDCAEFECGVGCAPCLAGDTCVSGTCVYAGACRITKAKRYSYLRDAQGYNVIGADGYPEVTEESAQRCSEVGSIRFFAYMDSGHRVGSDCYSDYTLDADGWCDYFGVFEALSK